MEIRPMGIVAICIIVANIILAIINIIVRDENRDAYIQSLLGWIVAFMYAVGYHVNF